MTHCQCPLLLPPQVVPRLPQAISTLQSLRCRSKGSLKQHQPLCPQFLRRINPSEWKIAAPYHHHGGAQGTAASSTEIVPRNPPQCEDLNTSSAARSGAEKVDTHFSAKNTGDGLDSKALMALLRSRVRGPHRLINRK